MKKEDAGGFAAAVDVLADGAGGLRGARAGGRSLRGPGAGTDRLRVPVMTDCTLDQGQGAFDYQPGGCK